MVSVAKVEKCQNKFNVCSDYLVNYTVECLKQLVSCSIGSALQNLARSARSAIGDWDELATCLEMVLDKAAFPSFSSLTVYVLYIRRNSTIFFNEIAAGCQQQLYILSQCCCRLLLTCYFYMLCTLQFALHSSVVRQRDAVSTGKQHCRNNSACAAIRNLCPNSRPHGYGSEGESDLGTLSLGRRPWYNRDISGISVSFVGLLKLVPVAHVVRGRRLVSRDKGARILDHFLWPLKNKCGPSSSSTTASWVFRRHWYLLKENLC